MMNRLRISFAAMLLVTVAALFALTGCGGKKSSSSAVKTTPTVPSATEELTETSASTSSAKVTTTAAAKKTKTTTTAVTTKKSKTTTAEVTTKKAKKTASGKTTTTAAAKKAVSTTQPSTLDYDESGYVEYSFRNEKLLNQHFAKHGDEFKDDFNYRTAAEYEQGASDVINDPDALFKYEAEDGDGVYYLEETNEFVILSKDGYIRTYFRPDGGKKYFDRQ